MELKVTGDMREIANSAWVSTLSERSVKAKTDEEVTRVVKFLIEHKHTSPLESVTLTFCNNHINDTCEINKTECSNYRLYAETEFARSNRDYISHYYDFTIDLLNFIKETIKFDKEFTNPFWLEFKKQRPELSEILKNFKPIDDEEKASDISKLFDTSNMSVELINIHEVYNNVKRDDSLSRATWRIKCPLSISVQLMRHRSGSFNMASGRYRTVTTEVIISPDDINNIFQKVVPKEPLYLTETVELENIEDYLGITKNCVSAYKLIMKKAKQSRDDAVISNDEYKRLREFARYILPEGRLTELYATFYLDDFYYNYLPLRNSPHAQTEHIWIAQEMQRVLEDSSGKI